MSINKRESFIFYGSFFESMRDLPDADRLALYDRICLYALTEEIDNDCLGSIVEGFWKLIKPQIDANYKKYKVGCKGAEYGKLGGRPRKIKTPQKPHKNPTKTPNENENENENVLKGGSKNKNQISFKKPTIEEIKSCCLERKNNINPAKFFNHYEAVGWKVGRSPMKDWQAAMRTWEDRDDGAKPIFTTSAISPNEKRKRDETQREFEKLKCNLKGLLERAHPGEYSQISSLLHNVTEINTNKNPVVIAFKKPPPTQYYSTLQNNNFEVQC